MKIQSCFFFAILLFGFMTQAFAYSQTLTGYVQSIAYCSNTEAGSRILIKINDNWYQSSPIESATPAWKLMQLKFLLNAAHMATAAIGNTLTLHYMPESGFHCDKSISGTLHFSADTQQKEITLHYK